MVFAADEANITEAGSQPVRLKKALETTLPVDLRHIYIENPNVVYWVSVDSSGKLSDYLAVEATHFQLLDKAEQELLEAEFIPAVSDGKTVQGKTAVVVSFYDPEQRAWQRGLMKMPMGSDLGDSTESRIYSLSRVNYIYRESEPENLDKPLQLLESELCLVHEPDKPMETGKVVVEYYVDHKGRVRHPRIIESDGESLSLSALMTLEKTLFSPPLRDGKPTYILVRQPFNFN